MPLKPKKAEIVIICGVCKACSVNWCVSACIFATSEMA